MDTYVFNLRSVAKRETDNGRSELGKLIDLAADEIEAARHRESSLKATIGFFASVIKSGEAWSEHCQKSYETAFGAEQRH